MKKVLLFAATVALLFATSCKKDANAPENVQLGENEFLVSIDNGAVPQNAPAIHDGMNTMTTIDEYRRVFWEVGDKIMINGVTATAKTGGNPVIFEPEANVDEADTYHAFYPFGIQMGIGAAGVLPVQQTYRANNIVSNLPMYAEGGKNRQLTFHNICAVLKITIPSYAENATSIVVSSDQRMNGEFTIGDNYAACMTNYTTPEPYEKMVTMVPATDDYKFHAGNTVYIAVPAQEYTNLRIEFFEGETSVWQKTIESCELRVNHVIDVRMTLMNWLCFEAVDNSSSVTFNEIPDLTDLDDNPVSIQYLTESADGTIGDWNNYSSGEEIPLSNVGDKVYFRASANHEASFGDGNNAQFSIEGQVKVSGNIMSLYGPNCPDNFNLPSSAFRQLFEYCEGLTEAQELELPAGKLGNTCYAFMFNGCTSLTKAPKLPAKQLVYHCYQNMFQGCVSLEEVYIYATGGFDDSECLDGWLDYDAGTEATNPTVHCKASVVTNIEANVDRDVWTVTGDL